MFILKGRTFLKKNMKLKNSFNMMPGSLYPKNRTIITAPFESLSAARDAKKWVEERYSAIIIDVVIYCDIKKENIE